jgi:hypothetical protein
MRLLTYAALLAAGVVASGKEDADWLVTAVVVTAVFLLATVWVTKRRVAVGNWGAGVEPYAKLDMALTVLGTLGVFASAALLVAAIVL